MRARIARHHRPLLVVLALALLTAAAARMAMQSPAPRDATAGVAAEAAAPVPPALAGEDLADPAPADRTVADRAPADPADAPPPTDPDFAAMVETLVSIGERTGVLAAADDIEGAQASDREARTLFDRLLDVFPDAGERALRQFAGLATPDDPRDGGRATVLQFVLAAELARRHEAAAAAGDRAAVDRLVADLLAALPLGERLAEAGAAVLHQRPYLRLVHEPAVLQLAALAGEDQVPRAVATALLLTLWDNLGALGERSPGDLASLAMLLLGDADPSQRTAACRHLLLQDRYRPTVLAWLRDRQDRAVAAEVARLAALELPPHTALSTLRELAPLLPAMPAAYMAVGHRDPEALVDGYETLLADDVQPGVRRDLLAGLGMVAAPTAAAALQLALHNDPDPEVRLQAMLSLSASAAERCGEAACQQLLDDPRIAADPGRLAIVVMALQNLEVAGLANAVDRLGQQLRNLPLRPDTRLELERLLARSLPSGGVRSGAGSNPSAAR